MVLSNHVQLDKDGNSFDSTFPLYVSDQVTRYDVRINAIYQNLNLRRRPCTESTMLQFVCETGCKSSYVLRQYGCFPLRYRSQIESENRSCTIQDLEKEPVSVYALEQELMDCSNLCLPNCEKTVFQVTSQQIVDRASGNFSESRIFISTHVYTIVEERLKSTWESFVGETGGALGVWLGLSFASVIHIPIFGMKALVRSIFHRRQEKAQNNL